MKNKTVEHLKIKARQYHRSKRGDHFEDGILIFHLYDATDHSRLTWWDDVTFILNDYRVALAWIHPRMAYEDMIEDAVTGMTADIPAPDIMGVATPIYKSAGKSRKTINSWRCDPVDRSDWQERYNQAREQAIQAADYTIAPSLTSRWGKYSRLVTLCAPLEVRNESDLRALAALAKRLLKREVTLEEVFPDYHYTRADWQRDNLHLVATGLHSHKVAP